MSTATSSVGQRRGGDEYVTFCTALRHVCGIDLLQYKRGQMERRIRSFAATRGAVDLASYATTLRTDKEELQKFLDRVTINVSRLWRNPEQWETLEQQILPDLAATARHANRLRAWSAGCSYGAEAYTLAAIARRTIPRAVISILGTDIDARMVQRARTGVFSIEDARDAPTATLAGHVELADGRWHASEELKRLVRFEQGDLLTITPLAGFYDLVLCRNTVIYFNDEARDALHERLVASLRQGGYLIVGTSERVSDPRRLGLESPFHFIYRKA
jgi:chemotaxis protein methyltransferase CheR